MPLNLATHWPTIVSLNDNVSNRNVEECPLDMHMVLWGSSEEITIRLFKSDVSSAYFSPEFGSPVYHYFQYQQNGFTPTNLPLFSETTLQPGEFLFIPNNYLISLKSTQQAAEKEVNLLKLCYFDASNVNDVRNALQVEALVSQTALQLLKQLNSPTEFDFKMTREPPNEITVEKYHQFPKEQEKKIELESDVNRRNRQGKTDHRGNSLHSLHFSLSLFTSSL